MWCGPGICSGYFLTSFHIGLVAGGCGDPDTGGVGDLQRNFSPWQADGGLQQDRCPLQCCSAADVLQCDQCPPALWRQLGGSPGPAAAAAAAKKSTVTVRRPAVVTTNTHETSHQK